MQFLAPDILEASRQLSPVQCGVGIALGLLLWLTGWWGHRFWIVLITTVITGVVGLKIGPSQAMKPLVAGLLCAIAGGVLALALVRVVAFAAGGAAAYLAVHAFAPKAWDEPLAGFLVGGLLGLLLFRFWTMTLTSLTGTLLTTYSVLSLLDRLGKLNALMWSEQQTSLLNGVCLGATAVGVVVQYLLERRRLRKQRQKEEELRHITEREQERLNGGKRWYQWGQRYRKAG